MNLSNKTAHSALCIHIPCCSITICNRFSVDKCYAYSKLCVHVFIYSAYKLHVS